MSDESAHQNVVARLVRDGDLQAIDIDKAVLASRVVARIHELAYMMTVEDAQNLVTQSERMLKGARKVNADPQLIAQYRAGLQAAWTFLKFRKDLERLRP